MKTADKFLKLQEKILKYDDDVKIHALIGKNLPFFKQLVTKVREQILAGNYHILYQPHCYPDGKIVGAEALFRLSIEFDGQKTKVNPFVLFAIANYFGLEEGLSLRAFNRVVEDTLSFKHHINNDFIVSYNLNPQFCNEHVCDQLIEIIDANRIARKNIAIELVEFYGLTQIKPETMEYYKKRGIHFYLDDFGSGYAKHHALDLPFDVIKYSGSVIIGIDKNPQNLEFVKDTIKIIQQKNMFTIAEHVETQAELKILSDLGITAVQGFVFDKMMTADELIQKYGRR